MIFNGGDSDGTIAEDEEIFYIWSRTVVPLLAHSSMAKETSSRDLQWWWQRLNNHRRRRNLLHMVKNGGAFVRTFTNGQGNFFMWSSMVVTVLEQSPKAKKLLHMVKNGGAVDSTFINGQGNFFTWSSKVVTAMEQSPKAKKSSTYGQEVWCR